jgi:hypothetical protein
MARRTSGPRSPGRSLKRNRSYAFAHTSASGSTSYVATARRRGLVGWRNVPSCSAARAAAKELSMDASCASRDISTASCWKFVLRSFEVGGGEGGIRITPGAKGGDKEKGDEHGARRGRRAVARYVFRLAQPRDVRCDGGRPRCVVAAAVVSPKVGRAGCRLEQQRLVLRVKQWRVSRVRVQSCGEIQRDMRG